MNGVSLFESGVRAAGGVTDDLLRGAAAAESLAAKVGGAGIRHENAVIFVRGMGERPGPFAADELVAALRSRLGPGESLQVLARAPRRAPVPLEQLLDDFAARFGGLSARHQLDAARGVRVSSIAPPRTPPAT
jgi:hypothetical protein